MQVLDRLKIELSNQEYFTDEQYIKFGRLTFLHRIKAYFTL